MGGRHACVALHGWAAHRSSICLIRIRRVSTSHEISCRLYVAPSGTCQIRARVGDVEWMSETLGLQ